MHVIVSCKRPIPYDVSFKARDVKLDTGVQEVVGPTSTARRDKQDGVTSDFPLYFNLPAINNNL